MRQNPQIKKMMLEPMEKAKENTQQLNKLIGRSNETSELAVTDDSR
jgi:hypothetical protein